MAKQRIMVRAESWGSSDHCFMAMNVESNLAPQMDTCELL